MAKVSLLAPLVVAAGCVVPRSRYDTLVTEYSAETQARRQLEDEVQRRDGELVDLRAKLREKDSQYSAVVQDAEQSKERIASLQQALAEAQEQLKPLAGGDVELVRTNEGFAYRIADQLLFDPGSTEIRDGGKKALSLIAKEILEKGYQNVRIDGHTDGDPVIKHKDRFKIGNYELAVERALSVFAFLTKDGKVPESVFTISGYGPSRPLVKETSDAAKARNRRVEIHVPVPKKS
jgi:flagellar motor protein MotB